VAKKRTVEPEELLDVDELKSFAMIATDDDDYDIGVMLPAAVSYVERWCNRALLSQTWAYTLREFPSRVVELPRPPLLSITSLAYVDLNGDSQSLTETTDFLKDIASEPGTIEPVWGTTWPTTRGETAAAVTITYKAGFGTNAEDVPAELRLACLQLAAHWYRNREAATPESQRSLPWGFHEVLRIWRVPTDYSLAS